MEILNEDFVWRYPEWLALSVRSAAILQDARFQKKNFYPLFGVTIIMPPPDEDEKVKAFVQALTLALQAIVGKPPERGGSKRRPQKHKKAVPDRAKRADQKS